MKKEDFLKELNEKIIRLEKIVISNHLTTSYDGCYFSYYHVEIKQLIHKFLNDSNSLTREEKEIKSNLTWINNLCFNPLESIEVLKALYSMIA